MRQLTDNLKMYSRYFSGFREYLRTPLSLDESRRRVERQLQLRNESFLKVLELGICSRLGSPYARLLAHAGIDFESVARSVRQDGIEPTLAALFDAGVYLTFEEFKGRRAVQRPGLEFPVRPSDFDNPLLARHYELRTGGSRGAGTRIIVDFDLLSHEAAYHFLSLENLRIRDRPVAIWYSVPPVVNGFKHVLRNAKIGQPVERWFSQHRLELRPSTLKYFVFTRYALAAGRKHGNALPFPEHTPLQQAWRVAQWLAQKKKAGTPGELHTNPSCGVRICLAARERDYDISGTFFRFNSEPYTPAKARVVEASGSRAAAQYSLAEIGNIGMACGNPEALDDVHLLTDKLALMQRKKQLASGAAVDALYYTTLLPSCPKLMLNVESDDYAVVRSRRCGCLFGEMGFDRHISEIRSYDKLTSEGMTFLGSELIHLLEEMLPSRFGGGPTDYQLVEEEADGLQRVGLIISPRVGPVDEGEVLRRVLHFIGSYPGAKKLMADLWEEAGSLRVIRREPYATGAAKILPLHILRKL